MQLTRRSIIGSIAAALAISPARLLAEQSKGRVVVAPISIEDGRIWVAVSLNKRPPVLFILDTGTMTNMVSEEIARSYKLKLKDDADTYGVGGKETGKLVHVDELTIGGAFHQEFSIFKTSTVFDRGDEKGALSCKFLTEFDCDLDFAKSEWRLYPDGRPNRDGLIQIPESYRPRADSMQLTVDAQIAGATGKFVLDTGAPGTMLLDGQMTEKTALWDSGAPYAPTQSRGFGPASVPCRLYRADRMKIHKFVFQRPLIRLMKPGIKMAKMYGMDGLIGLKGLRHFLISTDSKSKSLWLGPNGMTFPDEDDKYGLSGIWLEHEKDRISISDVGVGSPAANAGMQVGDVIVGKEWGALLSEINAAAGRLVKLDYERSGVRRTAEMTLQPYL